MSDVEIETLYRTKFNAVKSKEDTIKLQYNAIIKLQSCLSAFHLDKKRFLIECQNIEEKYNTMLRKAHVLLRDINRDYQAATKKLQVVELDSNLRIQALLRKHSMLERKDSFTSNPSSPISPSAKKDPAGTVTVRNVVTDMLNASSSSDGEEELLDVCKDTKNKSTQTQSDSHDSMDVSIRKMDKSVLESSAEDMELELCLSRAEALASLLLKLQHDLVAKHTVPDGDKITGAAMARVICLERAARDLELEVKT